MRGTGFLIRGYFRGVNKKKMGQSTFDTLKNIPLFFAITATAVADVVKTTGIEVVLFGYTVILWVFVWVEISPDMWGL